MDRGKGASLTLEQAFRGSTLHLPRIYTTIESKIRVNQVPLGAEKINLLICQQLLVSTADILVLIFELAKEVRMFVPHPGSM